jgi:hypothetical protein
MLTIRSCTSSYIVSRDHPEPERLRDRLDDIVLRTLPAALGSAFGGEEAGGEGLWFLRSLDIALDINTGWDDDEIARRWAEGIARSFAEATAEGGSGTLFFTDRAAYLACYFTRCADGSPAREWFFEPFSGLNALPASAAVRSVIEEEPDAGWTAFVRMQAADLEKVLSILDEADAGRILLAFGGRTASASAKAAASMSPGVTQSAPGGRSALSFRDAPEILLRTWSAPLRALSESAEALFHFLAAAGEHPDAAAMPLAQTAAAFTRLARRLQAGGVSARALLSALAGGDVATLYVVAGAADAEALRGLLGIASETVRRIGRTLGAPPASAAPEETASSSAAARFTPFGGAFLLLPIVDSLPPAGAAADRLRFDGEDPQSILRFLILIRCSGADRFEAGFRDPLLRDLFRIPPALSLADVRKWDSAAGAQLAAGFSAGLARWQAETWPEAGRAFTLGPLAGGREAVLVDADSDVWRWWGKTDELAGLAPLVPPEAVLCCRTESLRRAAEKALPGLRIRLDDSEPSLRPGRPAEDADFLRPRADPEGGSGAGRILALAVQNVMRAFANRLPGFSRSSLPHLRLNFLDLTASVEELPDRRVVRLGRPPLDLILSMAGLNRRSFRAPSIDDRPFELYQQE